MSDLTSELARRGCRIIDANLIFRCLSVRQPWASMIASGEKSLEIRSKSTRYRGDLLICASREREKIGADDLPRGSCLCLVRLVDCRLMTPADADRACHPYIEGHYVWELANVRPVAPVPVKGQLGIFTRVFPTKLEVVSSAERRAMSDECHGKELTPA